MSETDEACRMADRNYRNGWIAAWVEFCALESAGMSMSGIHQHMNRRKAEVWNAFTPAASRPPAADEWSGKDDEASETPTRCAGSVDAMAAYREVAARYKHTLARLAKSDGPPGGWPVHPPEDGA